MLLEIFCSFKYRQIHVGHWLQFHLFDYNNLQISVIVLGVLLICTDRYNNLNKYLI